MKIYFIDIDSTLMFQGGIPEVNKIAIRQARKNGDLIIINTGRSKAYIPWEKINEIEYDGVIAGLGTYIEFNGKVIESNPMPKETCLELIDLFERLNKWIVLEGEEICININSNWAFNDNTVSMDDYKEKYYNSPISKFSCDVIDELDQKAFPENLDYIVHKFYIEGSVKGTSKKNGIITLLKYLGKSSDICVGIGDSENDFSMFEICAESVAVGNSSDDIKERCSYVTIDAKDGGVAEAICHFSDNLDFNTIKESL